MTLRRLLASVLLVLALAPGARHLSAQQPPAQPQEEFVPLNELPPEERLPSAPLLVAAYAFVWLALGAYVLSVARRLTTVQKEVERLEGDLKRGTRA